MTLINSRNEGANAEGSSKPFRLYTSCVVEQAKQFILDSWSERFNPRRPNLDGGGGVEHGIVCIEAREGRVRVELLGGAIGGSSAGEVGREKTARRRRTRGNGAGGHARGRHRPHRHRCGTVAALDEGAVLYVAALVASGLRVKFGGMVAEGQ